MSDTGRVRYGQAECEHGAPGGSPDTCALCRVQLARDLERLERAAMLDPRALAAGADR